MKKSLIAIVGVLVAGMVFAQSEETRSLSSFSRISAHEGINVYLQEGNQEQARVVARDIDIEDVLTEVSGDRLKIHIDRNRWNNRNIDVDVYVTYKSLEALSASSAASISGKDPIETDGDFDVDVSSAGEIEAEIIADELTIDASSAGDVNLKVNVSELEADASSSGDIEIEGVAKFQDIETSSSGDFDGYDVESEEVRASASSGGSIKINVTNRIDARASSGGSVRYKGSPRYVDVSSSSGGSVKKY